MNERHKRQFKGSQQQKLQALVDSLATADADSLAARAVKERYAPEQGRFPLTGAEDFVEIASNEIVSLFRDTLVRHSRK